MSFFDYSALLFDASLGTFGASVQYTQKDGVTFQLSGVFTREYELVQSSDMNTVISSRVPVVEVAVKDLKRSPLLGDTLLIRDLNYKVIEVQPNGEGQVRLILKRHLYE